MDKFNNLKILLLCWGLASIWYIYTLIRGQNTWTVLSEMILFSFLGLQLLLINFCLLRLMNQLFGKDALRKEKNFLIFTVIFFSLSYFLQVSENITTYIMIKNSNSSRFDLFCRSNFFVSLINILVFVTTEWLPYMIIFVLNYRNFRIIDS